MPWHFYWSCINSINGLKENWYLYNVDSSEARTEDDFPFAGLCLAGRSKMFTSRVCWLLTMFASKYLIFFIAAKMGFSLTLWAKSGYCSCIGRVFVFGILFYI